MKYPILIVFVSLSLGCQNQKISSQVEGVWMFYYKVNNQYRDDTTGFFESPAAVIIDLQKSGDMVLKSYDVVDTVMTWKLASDTVLKLGPFKYRLFNVNSDSLSLVDYNAVDTFWIVYKRPSPITIGMAPSKVKNLLMNKIWSVKDYNNWQKHFEYFENNSMLYRYKIFDESSNDSIDNLQIETYGIDVYKGYTFLYHYMDYIFDNGGHDVVYQITSISPNSYSINDPRNGQPVQYTSQLGDENLYLKTKENIVGRWVSKNSSAGSDSLKLAHHREKPFIGDLIYELLEDGKVKIYLDNQLYDEGSWVLGKDSQLLFFEMEVEELDKKGVHIDYMDVLEFKDSYMKLRLFKNTTFYTETSNRYRVKRIQEFHKQQSGQ